MSLPPPLSERTVSSGEAYCVGCLRKIWVVLPPWVGARYGHPRVAHTGFCSRECTPYTHSTPPPKKWLEDERVVFMYFLPTGIAPHACPILVVQTLGLGPAL